MPQIPHFSRDRHLKLGIANIRLKKDFVIVIAAFIDSALTR
jgi:hypothetical protein